MNQTEQIFCNGPIVTLEEGPAPQAVLVRGERIAALGSRAELEAMAPGALRRDLEGRALLPAFLDAHSHITAVAATLDLCPLGDAASPEEAAQRMARFRAERAIPEGEWVIGFGYDHNVFPGKAHPTRAELDRALPRNPALMTHASGHMGTANGLALSRLGLSRDTPDPEGGRLGRDAGGALTGYLEEAAFFAAAGQIPKPSPAQALANLERAQEVYLAHGITLAQDGRTGREEDQLLSTLAARDRLKLEVVGYADLQHCPELVRRPPVGRYRVGGYKIFLDGSPQGRTAWRREPTVGGGADYRGSPAHTDEEVAAAVERALREGRQLLAHCNGDAAAGQFLTACRRAQERVGRPVGTIRPVMIHAQTVGSDQLREAAELGVIPSFFAAHIWYWGDVHLENLGRARGAHISPAGTAAGLGLPFTLHQDSPVLPPDPLESVWCAVCRRTRGGARLAEEERVSPREALRAVTRYAARQYGLERERGRIVPGQRADFVLLSGDPTAVEPEEIRSLRVEETIRAGETVYRAGIQKTDR